MTIVVCGGRDYADAERVDRVLTLLMPFDRVLQGGATGADQLARRWCELVDVECVDVEANWDEYGKAAGPIRNQAMIEMRPDVVLAFPGGRGTADMVLRARKAGVLVLMAS